MLIQYHSICTVIGTDCRIVGVVTDDFRLRVNLILMSPASTPLGSSIPWVIERQDMFLQWV